PDRLSPRPPPRPDRLPYAADRAPPPVAYRYVAAARVPPDRTANAPAASRRDSPCRRPPPDVPTPRRAPAPSAPPARRVRTRTAPPRHRDPMPAHRATRRPTLARPARTRPPPGGVPARNRGRRASSHVPRRVARRCHPAVVRDAVDVSWRAAAGRGPRRRRPRWPRSRHLPTTNAAVPRPPLVAP